MAHISKLVAAVLAALTPFAYAGYAELAPPPGWFAGTGASTRATFQAGAAAANEAAWVANTVRTSAALNVGGRALAVPVGMRMAANAPLFLAERLGVGLVAGLLSPMGIALTVGAFLVLPAVTQWFEDSNVIYDPATGTFKQRKKAMSGYWPNRYGSGQFGDASSACADQGPPGYAVTVVYLNEQHTSADCQFAGLGSLGQVGFVGSVSTTLETVPFSVVKPLISATPFPDDFPNQVPIPYPVDDPVINPSPALQPQPLQVPQGSPQPVSETDPQQYKQPVVRVTPAPSTSRPWQVDVTPEDVVGTDPNGQADPVTPTASSPATSTPKDSDLCLLHPEIIACQKVNLDTPSAPDLSITEKPISVAMDGGWGATDAACPAPRYIYPQGRQIAIPFDLFCQYMSGIRPIIIALAWLGAGFILIGARGGD